MSGRSPKQDPQKARRAGTTRRRGPSVDREPAATVSRETSHAGASPGVDIEHLLARYAPLGRRQRKTRTARRVGVLLSVPVAGLLGYQLSQAVAGIRLTDPFAAIGEAIVTQQLKELRDLKGLLVAETRAASAQRREWEEERQLFQRQSAELIQQLNQITAQRQELDQQHQRFEEQRVRLEDAIARLDGQARELENQRELFGRQAPLLEQQVAEIRRQREELDRQRGDFSAQGKQLARELDELTAHRLELERQQQELQALLARLTAEANQQSSSRSARGTRNPDLTGGTAAGEEPLSPVDALTAPLMAGRPAVQADVLGEMRGGLNVGSDYEISIGLTRSASINGIEQFSSSLYIDDLAAAVGAGGSPAVDPVVIQNGPGNMVSPDVLSALAAGNVATFIQNTLDNQSITTQTVIDLSLSNVSGVMQGISTSQAVAESVSLTAR